MPILSLQYWQSNFVEFGGCGIDFVVELEGFGDSVTTIFFKFSQADTFSATYWSNGGAEGTDSGIINDMMSHQKGLVQKDCQKKWLIAKRFSSTGKRDRVGFET